MVRRFPHTLILSTVADSTQDASGNWVAGSSSTKQVPCRYEPNSSSDVIKAQDGQQIVYDGIVYADIMVDTIALGTNLEIKNGAEAIAKGTVKQFHKGQLNTTVWL
jgi:hypothetical protein